MNTDKKIENLEKRIETIEKHVNIPGKKRADDVLLKMMLKKFVRAAEKQRSALDQGGWGHAIWCNFGTENDFCNCGIADLQRVLDLYEESNEEKESDSDQDHPLDLLRRPKQ